MYIYIYLYIYIYMQIYIYTHTCDFLGHSMSRPHPACPPASDRLWQHPSGIAAHGGAATGGIFEPGAAIHPPE